MELLLEELRELELLDERELDDDELRELELLDDRELDDEDELLLDGLLEDELELLLPADVGELLLDAVVMGLGLVKPSPPHPIIRPVAAKAAPPESSSRNSRRAASRSSSGLRAGAGAEF